MTDTNDKTKAVDELAEVVKRELSKCAKCGQCASVCPIYSEKNEEGYSARGKLVLARSLANGELEMTPKIREMLENCLVCMACVANCSSNVRMDQVVMAARRLLVRETGQPLLKKIIFRSLLPSAQLMNTAMAGGSLMQPLAFSVLPESSGLRRRFPLPGIAKDQAIPAISLVPFLRRVSEIQNSVAPVKERITYFAGCSANYLFPTIGESLVHVLHAFGYGVRIPKDQICCGTPAAVNGEKSAVRELAGKNISLLSRNEDTVITACGSCGLMFRHDYALFWPEDDPMQSAIAALAGRSKDISEFLVKEVGLEAIKAKCIRKVSVRATYHESCHLSRGVGVVRQPRDLLKLVASDFEEMPEANRCCGSGGTYGLTHWDTSKAILKQKINNAQKVGARIIVTGCPACIIQLSAGSDIAGAGISVFHSIELLAWSMGYKPGSKTDNIRFALLERQEERA